MYVCDVCVWCMCGKCGVCAFGVCPVWVGFVVCVWDACYKYRVNGKGKVVAQSVVAGTALKKGNVILIRLQ